MSGHPTHLRNQALYRELERPPTCRCGGRLTFDTDRDGRIVEACDHCGQTRPMATRLGDIRIRLATDEPHRRAQDRARWAQNAYAARQRAKELPSR